MNTCSAAFGKSILLLSQAISALSSSSSYATLKITARKPQELDVTSLPRARLLGHPFSIEQAQFPGALSSRAFEKASPHQDLSRYNRDLSLLVCRFPQYFVLHQIFN